MTSDNTIDAMADSIVAEKNLDAKSGGNATGSNDSWPAALSALVSARLEIISAESQGAISAIASKVVWAGIAVLCGFFFWVTAMAGLIGFIPRVSGLDWFHVAFIIAAIHLLVIVISVIFLTKKSAPVFEVTKSEFIKDKQWLSTVNQKTTSRN